jgi:magnesium chelatase family protein
MAAIIGGGRRANPGEVSLAHQGVLFLDELPEFGRQVLDTLRQPVETGRAVIARANMHVTYPARFQLVAAMNPCRCGHLDDAARACSRAPKCAMDYRARISGPMLDRIDIFVEVLALNALDLTRAKPSEPTEVVAERVARARNIQYRRYSNLSQDQSVRTNAEADGDVLQKAAPLDAECLALMENAIERFKLSARGYHRVLKVARTLADLQAAENINKTHVAEALSYRQALSG